jgi:hypothetical protein
MQLGQANERIKQIRPTAAVLSCIDNGTTYLEAYPSWRPAIAQAARPRDDPVQCDTQKKIISPTKRSLTRIRSCSRSLARELTRTHKRDRPTFTRPALAQFGLV